MCKVNMGEKLNVIGVYVHVIGENEEQAVVLTNQITIWDSNLQLAVCYSQETGPCTGNLQYLSP